MNLIELNRALGQLRLGGIAAVLETRLRQAQAEATPPIDFLSCLVSDELTRRGERLLERRKKQAEFRDPQKTLDNFDFNFNRKMNRSLVFDLAAGAFIARHEDGLFLGFWVHHRWNPKRNHGTVRFRTASDYRRPRYAEVTHDRRRGLAGNRNAAL